MNLRQIPLYKVRTFSQKLSDTFDFTLQNKKPLFRFCIYLLLPLCLMSGWVGKIFWSEYMGMVSNAGIGDAWWYSYGGYILSSVVMSVVMISIVYGLMTVDRLHPGSLSTLSLKDFWPVLRRNIKRMLLMVLACVVILFVVVGVVALFAFVSPWTLMVTIPAFIVLMYMLTLLPPVYLLEDDITIVEAVRKSLRYGFHTFWGVVGVLFIISMVVYFVASIFMVPTMLLVSWQANLFPGLSVAPGSGMSVLLSFGSYVMMVLASFANYIVSSVLFVGLAYQYGHAADKLDGASVSEGIERFDELADTNVDAPELSEEKSDIDHFDQL